MKNNMYYKKESPPIYIPWSGGLDSTYMIYSTLRDNPNARIRAAYIEISNNRDKTVIELARTEAMARIFRDLFPKRFEFDGTVITINVQSGNGCMKFHQMPIWICGILMSLPANTEEVALSYVMNDDAISYLQELGDIWRSYAPIVNGDMPQLTFPMMKMKKEDFALELPSNIQRLIWSCEIPTTNYDSSIQDKFVPCQKCCSCKRSPFVHLTKKSDHPQLSSDPQPSSTNVGPAANDAVGGSCITVG